MNGSTENGHGDGDVYGNGAGAGHGDGHNCGRYDGNGVSPGTGTYAGDGNGEGNALAWTALTDIVRTQTCLITNLPALVVITAAPRIWSLR